MSRMLDMIDDPIGVHYSTGTSDAQAASDNAAGVLISGISEVVFFIEHSAVIGEGGAAASVQIQYSSGGSASDAVTSNATMSCTDAVILFTTAVNGAAGIYTLDFSVARKGLPDGAGKLYAVVQNDSTSNLTVRAVPVVAQGRLPQYTATVTADD